MQAEVALGGPGLFFHTKSCTPNGLWNHCAVQISFPWNSCLHAGPAVD